MSITSPATPEVFTVRDVAKAAGVPVADVRAALRDPGTVVAERFFLSDEAVRLVRALKAASAGRPQPRGLFAPPRQQARHPGAPLAASSALHLGALAIMVLIAGLGVRTAPSEQRTQEPAHLVFVVSPGPGGGGGGGGLRQSTPPPRAEIRGKSKLRSPVTVARKIERPEPPKRVETPVPPPAPVVQPKPEPVPPPPPAPAPTPPVVAPVVTAPADADDRAGVVTETAANTPSNGPGLGGGTGTGRGTGSGPGSGAGIGEGTIAGTGGGPYRPGSGVSPPGLLREVKPIYTEEGRRRGVEGDVVMEVVVRSDGSVGAVRILQGLGAGLDQRATEAVRQWKFSPARRQGSPVDVLVEVAVEFRLR
jgi:periplasmic protein TonB